MSSWEASSPSALLNITKRSCWPHLHLVARFRRFPDTLSRPMQSILEREHVWISNNNSCRASLLIHILRLSFLAPFYKVKYILISHMWETKPGIKRIRPFLSFQIVKSIKKKYGHSHNTQTLHMWHENDRILQLWSTEAPDPRSGKALVSPLAALAMAVRPIIT